MADAARILSVPRMVQEGLRRLTAVYLTIAATRLITGIIDRLRYLNFPAPTGSTSQYLKSFCGVLKILAIFIAVVVVIGSILINHQSDGIADLGATSAVLAWLQDTFDGLVAGIPADQQRDDTSATISPYLADSWTERSWTSHSLP